MGTLASQWEIDVWIQARGRLHHPSSPQCWDGWGTGRTLPLRGCHTGKSWTLYAQNPAI